MAEASRLALLGRLQRHEDFQITLMLAATEQAGAPIAPRWLACQGWWAPDAGHHVCYFADITGIEQSRQTAQTLTNRIKVLFEHLPVMVASIGPRPLGLCHFANRRFAKLFGFDENSIIDVPVMDMVGEKVVTEMKVHTKRLLETRLPVTFEHEVMTATGVLVWHEVTIAFATYPRSPGAEKGFHFLLTDITEGRKAELALRESEDRLSRFMEASAEGVLFHRDGLITDVNPAASRLFGAPVEQLLGRSAMELVAPEYRARASSVIAAGADASYESEIFNVHGARIPVE
ncbi:PAS domain-containing protein, partial [Hydrogenophaga sp.]|uniref:PAS domain-containing protein n=1 Tax=Hydrogenophaga sp. TaxID=1904254 RepID=UPI00272F1342